MILMGILSLSAEIAELNESVVSYELGFSKPFGVRPRFRLYYGAALTGNFSRWERVIYKYPNELSRVNQVSPGLLGFTRAECWWKYRPYKSLDEEDLINCIIGLSARFSYMGFRPDVWPCPDWFGIIEGYVGVRW